MAAKTGLGQVRRLPPQTRRGTDATWSSLAVSTPIWLDLLPQLSPGNKEGLVRLIG